METDVYNGSQDGINLDEELNLDFLDEDSEE